MVGKLLFGAVVAGAVGYGYPLWNEHAGTACQAVEQRFLTIAGAARPHAAVEAALLRQWLEPLSGGAVAAAHAKQQYPDLPPEVGCTAAYWGSLLDAGELKHRLAASLPGR